MINISLKYLKGEPITYLDSLANWWDHNSFVSSCRDWVNSIRAFLSNLPMFIKFAWVYRSWDYTYQIEIFSTLLMDLGKNIKEHGHAINSEKCARRAFTAAGLLRKAYLENVPNKTCKYLYKKYGYSFMHNYKPPPEHLEKMIEAMRKIADLREEKADKELKKQAWDYIHKYIDHMWD